MSDVPEHLVYSSTHEWLEQVDNSHYTLGITDYAQEALGELVFVELPSIGSQFASGEVCAVLESVKAASEIYAPLDCEIINVNEALNDNPELINSTPYNDGWIVRIKPKASSQIDACIDAAAYRALIE